MPGKPPAKRLGAALLITFCILAGCGDPTIDGVSDADGESANTHSVDNSENRSLAVDPVKAFEWSVPAAGLIVTGHQIGYIEPCGCTEEQSGGLSRRGDLIRQLTERGWTLAGLDVGSLIRRHRLQSRFKFETSISAMKDLGYRAVSLGPEELALGLDYLLSQHILDDPKSIRFVTANLTFYDFPELGTPARSHVFEIGKTRVGVTGILGDSIRLQVLPRGYSTEVQYAAPEDVLPDVLASLRNENPDLLVLLLMSDAEEATRLAEAFPEFDLIVSSSGPEDPWEAPSRVGRTLIVQVGRKGKRAGVVGFYPDEQPRLRYELVELDRHRFGDTPAMIEHMRYYQTRLKNEQIAVAEPAVDHPSGATFVGAKACADCHETAYEIWKHTPHAHAWESLDPANELPGFERLKGIARTHDPECLACHVTGWHPQEVYRYRTGFINEEYAADDAQVEMYRKLQGNQCENCHGPGSRHIELVETGDVEAAGQEVRVTLEQARDKVCNECHDLDNSPAFEFDPYWEEVRHYELSSDE